MITCPEACLPSLGVSIWGISTSSKPRSKRLCLELSGRKKKAPKHKVMKALRMRRRMNFSESLNVALWCGKEEAPGDRVGILRPDSGSRAGVVIFWPFEINFTRDGVRWVSQVSRVAVAACTDWFTLLSHPCFGRSRNQKRQRSLSNRMTCQQEHGHDGSEKKYTEAFS